MRGLLNMLKGRPALRGRVARVALVLSGEVSVTIRFGLDELEAAKKLLPGVLAELVVIAEKPKALEPLVLTPPRKRRPRRAKAEQITILGTDE